MPITDHRSAREWLERQPKIIQSSFASRCALRALPAIGTQKANALRRFMLPVLRANISAVAACVDVAEERPFAAAHAAYHASDYAAEVAVDTHALTSAKTFASTAASLAADAAGEVCLAAASEVMSSHQLPTADHAAEAFSFSVGSLEKVHGELGGATCDAAADDALILGSCTPQDIFQRPIWPALRETADENGSLKASALGIMPYLGGGRAVSNQFTEASIRLKYVWELDLETWGFWARWYGGMLSGRPLTWELQRRVALIDYELWLQGPSQVAKCIAEIEREL